MPRVYTATPYEPGAMGSLGNAAYMLHRQHNFPDTYDKRDRLSQADHDRIFQWDYKHAEACLKKHTGFGTLGLGDWARRADPAAILAFIVEILAPFNSPLPTGMEWTGFRVMGTVNRSNGYSVWTLEIFAKHPDSKTVVYSGEDAPNVRQPKAGTPAGYDEWSAPQAW